MRTYQYHTRLVITLIVREFNSFVIWNQVTLEVCGRIVDYQYRANPALYSGAHST